LRRLLLLPLQYGAGIAPEQVHDAGDEQSADPATAEEKSAASTAVFYVRRAT
jgi:hypothetical protein